MATALTESGRPVQVIPDLCRWAAKKDRRLHTLLEQPEIYIIACYPRAVKSLLEAAGVALTGKRVHYLNPREESADAILAALPEVSSSATAREFGGDDGDGQWVPWFPVIDYDRCQHCQQCLSFCLFGVYERTSEGRVVVSHPENCKNQCPACARICPEVAIQFPKLAEPPLNGAPIVDEQLERAKVKVNLEQAFGNNAYAALAERRRKARLRRLVAEPPSNAADPKNNGH